MTSGRRIFLVRCHPRGGFTLVELLVVIAIIGVLFAVLLPALGRAKVQARLVQCASNERQVGQLFATYNADCFDYVAPATSPHNIRRGRTQAGAQIADVSSGNPVGLACPDAADAESGGVALERNWPTSMGWFYWMGYLKPVTPRGKLGFLDCPDTTPFRDYGVSYGQFNEVVYTETSSISADLATRQTAPPGGAHHPQGGNWDCNTDYATWAGYTFRGWQMNFAAGGSSGWVVRASRWAPDNAILVDFERMDLFTGTYLANHGDGLNILFADGHVRFGGKDIAGYKPHVYELITNSSQDIASAYANGNSGLAYLGGPSAKLWAYYETNVP